MIDFVFPKENEKDFIHLAERLGLDGICFVYDSPKAPPSVDTKLKISTAVLCTPKTIQKYKSYTTIMRAGDDPRVILEQYRPDFIYGLESSSRKDFVHHRASGLNQVLCALAKKNNISVLFSFEDVLAADSKRRAILLGRISQNKRFARKFGFSYQIASLTTNPFHLRPKRSFDSLEVIL